MKQRTIFGIMAIIAIIALTLTACPPGPEPDPQIPLTNTVRLDGQNLVGGTLTAVIDGNTGEGTPAITIADKAGNTYEITFEDVGQKIKVVAVYGNGSIEYTMPDAVPAPTMTVQLTGDEDGVFAGETTLTMTTTVGNVANGFNPGITHSWKAGNNEVGTGATLSVTNAMNGQTITGTAGLTEYPDAKDSKTAKYPVTVPIVQNHTGSITAFGKTATVTGAGSIPEGDFNTAVGNLSVPLAVMGNTPGFPTDLQNRFINLMTRGITIVPGNAVPASVGGVLTVGVDYLISNTEQTIGGDIYNLVDGGAFAMAAPAQRDGYVRYTKAMQRRDGYIA